MKTAVCTLSSVSPYGQSKFHDVPRNDKESADAHEARTWRERCHYDEKTREVYIPPMSFKWAISDAAKFLGQRIPGKGQRTWSKHFASGVLVVDKVPLGVKVDDVRGEWLFLHANGQRGSGTRVRRCMPIIDEWKANVTFHILDDAITEAAFEYHLEEAGKFIGIGRFRPQNGGFLGRFEVKKIAWSNGK